MKLQGAAMNGMRTETQRIRGEVPNETAQAAMDQLKQLGEKASTWAGEHPRLLLCSGLLLGGIVGWLLKRKT
jgi:hypothetical protein